MHGADSDLKVLRKLEIHDDPLRIIDTQKAAKYPLQLYYRYSLEKLLEALEIPYAALHAAGNDAHFSLRTVLMIAVKDAERQPNIPSHSHLILNALNAIAHAPWPLTTGETRALIHEVQRLAKLELKARREAKSAASSERKEIRTWRIISSYDPLIITIFTIRSIR